MTADPTPSSALAGIRERIATGHRRRPECGCVRRAARTPQRCGLHRDGRAPSLLAAVEAVLELADDWDAEARGIFLVAARTADAGEVGAASALQSCAADLREAISREITGKGEGQ